VHALHSHWHSLATSQRLTPHSPWANSAHLSMSPSLSGLKKKMRRGVPSFKHHTVALGASASKLNTVYSSKIKGAPAQRRLLHTPIGGQQRVSLSFPPSAPIHKMNVGVYRCCLVYGGDSALTTDSLLLHRADCAYSPTHPAQVTVLLCSGETIWPSPVPYLIGSSQ
jgi:hypothetical protein